MYELSFWAAGGAAPDNSLRITLATQQTEIQIPAYTQSEFDALGGLEWNKYIVPFTAVDTTMYLSVLSPNSTNPAFNSIVYLDNFFIVAVPEPSGVMLVLAAGLTLGIRRRRMDSAYV
jgi:hypothetical protein